MRLSDRGNIGRGGIARSCPGAALRSGRAANFVLALLCAGLLARPLQAHEARKFMKLAAGESQLVVPSTLVAAPSTAVPLRISVTSPRELPPNSFVRIRGLPPAVALSDGYAIAPGVWAVPLASLGNLRMIIPVGVTGGSNVSVNLVSVDGASLAEGHMVLTVTETQGGLKTAPQAGLPGLPPPRAALAPEARERATKLVQRGEQALATGNVAQARGFFMLAAEAGLAAGALMLGATYDPGELARLNVQGVQPNTAEARKWYEKAQELGAPEAQERLIALSKR